MIKNKLLILIIFITIASAYITIAKVITFHSLGSNVSKYLSSSLSELDELLSLLSLSFSSECSSGSEFERDIFFLLRDT